MLTEQYFIQLGRIYCGTMEDMDTCVLKLCIKRCFAETDFKIWYTFVSACRKLVSPIVSDSDAPLADLLYLRFCKHVERKYGELFITPNMHLHFGCSLSKDLMGCLKVIIRTAEKILKFS